MCDITIYGKSLCACGFGFKASASSHKDCRSPRCAASQTHPRTCVDHSKCAHPGEQRVMDVKHTMPCFECERELMVADGMHVDIVEPIEVTEIRGSGSSSASGSPKREGKGTRY